MIHINRHSRIAVVGAGFAGATVANLLANAGYTNITVFDKRDHVAGNCHTYVEPTTGVAVHRYGPHIFHTDNTFVWNYVQQFDPFVPYIQRTKATAKGHVYSFPINLHTLNQVHGESWSPDEAREMIGIVTDGYKHWEPENFRDAALQSVGPLLYRRFLESYTKKQWGVDPFKLPASILKRLPVRFDYNDNAYNHRFQGIPPLGYTHLVANMLHHDGIKLRLKTEFVPGSKTEAMFDLVFWSGPIDAYFQHAHGRLPYRTLALETQILRDTDDYQGCAVMNYCDADVPFTRITEHKHFLPGGSYSGTVITKEFPHDCQPWEDPYYPMRIGHAETQIKQYEEMASKCERTIFIGRLGTFQYLDMDKTIELSMAAVRGFIAGA